MNVVTQPLWHELRQVFMVEVVLVSFAAAIFFVARDWSAVLATFYGGGITLLSGWWIGRRIYRAADLVRDDKPSAGTLVLFQGAIERLLLVVVALVLAIEVFKMSLLPLLSGFIVAHVGYFFGGNGQDNARK